MTKSMNLLKNWWFTARARRKGAAGKLTEGAERAFVYARVASAAGAGDAGGRQLRTCRRYAARKGFRIVAEAIDAPASGLADDRPGFAALMAAVSSGGIKVVLVQDLARISRSPPAIDSLMKTAAKSSVRVIETGRDDDESEG